MNNAATSKETTVGENIRRIRKAKNMTQKELGEKLGGISQQQVGQWENGIKNPKIETVKKISEALNVDPFSLYSFDMATQVLEEDLNENHLLDNYRQLNEPGQKEAVRQVELLTKIPEYKKAPEE